MQLHVLPGSPNCHKVLAAAHHLELDIEVIEKQLFGSEFQSDDFLTLNPNAKTPVLRDGPFSLWESNAICVYLAGRHSKPIDLFPSKSRPEILQWLFWETSHYNDSLGTIAWQAVIKPNLLSQDPDEGALETATENFHKYAQVLDAHLDDSNHVVGNEWTIADYSVGALEKFMEAVPLDFDRYPNIRSFYENLRNNPHWSATRLSLESLLNAA